MKLTRIGYTKLGGTLLPRRGFNPATPDWTMVSRHILALWSYILGYEP